MKKIFAALMALLMLATALPLGLAEETAEYSLETLNVAVTNPLTGQFFTGMWGNATSDADVRALLHGYNLIYWDAPEGRFATDDAVVSGLVVTQDAQGNRTYTLSLYDDLFYSDGTPITAWDYAFSMLLTMAPQMQELDAQVRTPHYLLGYDEYISGKASALAGVRVFSDYLMAITVRAEYLPFFYELGLLDCVPYPIAVIAPGSRVADDGRGVYIAGQALSAAVLRRTVLDENGGYRTFPSVVSGPYRLTAYSNGTARFERNPYYKGDAYWQVPTIEHITFTCLAGENLVPALRDGTATLLNKVTGAAQIAQGMALAAQSDAVDVTNYTRSGVAFISFNADRAPLDSLAVRQAVAYLADKTALSGSIVSNFGVAVDGYYGLGQWMYQLVNGTVTPVTEPAEGASAQERAEYEQQLAAWKALSLEDIPTYAYSMEAGVALLEEAGWRLNEQGDAFVAGTDSLRCRREGEKLVPLRLTLAYPEGSAAASVLENDLVQNLARAGIALTVSAIPMAELLPQYYHTQKPAYDMFFLATNFDLVYDPSAQFTEEDGTHVWTTSGIADEALWQAAVAMRQTEPGDLLTYCTHWLDFEKEFCRVLPALPIYSNIYFDFYANVLHDYHINANISWAQAINLAYLAEAEEAAEEPEEEEEFFE